MTVLSAEAGPPPGGETRSHTIGNALLGWFASEQRAFPWRSTADPFAILIAEKLLQQTAAGDGVVRAFHGILARYPDPARLAVADEAELLEFVQPLGLAYRVHELLALAAALVERHAGRVPDDLAALRALPGVGDYAARAVLSFAFGQDVAVVDTNVARFLHRVFGLPGLIPANPARSARLLRLAATLLPPGRSRDYNLAVLDLCAKVCTARRPHCSLCPIFALCNYGQQSSTGDGGAAGFVDAPVPVTYQPEDSSK